MVVKAEGEEILRWIPAEKSHPLESGKYLVTIKHHKWISDYDSGYVPDCDKVVHPEHMEVYGAVYNIESGEWIYVCQDNGGSAGYAAVDPDVDISRPVDEVTAWMPQPDPYRTETEQEAPNGDKY